MRTNTASPHTCRRIIRIALAAAAALLIFWSPAGQALAEGKSADLERKIADIDLLRGQLGERMRQAGDVRIELSRQKTELIAEIGAIAEKKKIKSFQQAREELRIRYDLELLRLIGAYLNALQNKMRQYQTDNDKLAYLRQSAADDLKMLAALNDLEIDALATQISLVISQCLPEAHVVALDPADLQAMSAEKAWEGIASGRF